jgi:hypothetical protein
VKDDAREAFGNVNSKTRHRISAVDTGLSDLLRKDRIILKKLYGFKLNERGFWYQNNVKSIILRILILFYLKNNYQHDPVNTAVQLIIGQLTLFISKKS